MKRKAITEWVVIFLIILFFAIPVCGMVVSESAAGWQKCASYLFIK
ncbi:MAG TPA: hypothetical protein VLS90_18900 [Thermodesulfobacteriota bacterium]|nr:hypothetical protein [Thermodesulfobacteriota bacterium]